MLQNKLCCVCTRDGSKVRLAKALDGRLLMEPQEAMETAHAAVATGLVACIFELKDGTVLNALECLAELQSRHYERVEYVPE